MSVGWYKQQPHAPIQIYDAETIKDIQRTLQCPETGVMDTATVNHIKGLQYAIGIQATGVINERTAEGIETLRSRYADTVERPTR